MISPISNIASIPITNPISPIGGADSSSGFSAILKDTISSLQSTQTEADSAVQKFLTGENDDIHTTVLATQRAEMAFELGLQVRNKVVSAYQEVMKMQL